MPHIIRRVMAREEMDEVHVGILGRRTKQLFGAVSVIVRVASAGGVVAVVDCSVAVVVVFVFFVLFVDIAELLLLLLSSFLMFSISNRLYQLKDANIQTIWS